jgi:hypothetical protein
MKDKKIFKKFMMILGEIHSREVSAALLEAYWLSLDGFTDEDCSRAFTKLIQTLRFFPKPADVIEAIRQDDPKVEDVALMQATDIVRQVRDLGAYRTPLLDDPITKWLMSARWTWRTVCAMTEEEHKWFFKEFVEAYKAFDRNKLRYLDLDAEKSQRLRLLAGGIGK